MRKSFWGFLCVLLSVVCLTEGVLAAETYANIDELYQHWFVTAMPEWVCSVTSTDGTKERLTVMVNSQDAAEQLAAMVEDESTMTVMVSADAYTHAQLMQVKEEIVDKYMMNASGEPAIVSAGVGWASIDGVVTGFGESGRETRVVVGVLEKHADEYRELFRKQYGDMVYVKVSGGAFVTDSSLGAADTVLEVMPIQQTSTPMLYSGGMMVVLCVAVAAFLLWKKRRKAN